MKVQTRDVSNFFQLCYVSAFLTIVCTVHIAWDFFPLILVYIVLYNTEKRYRYCRNLFLIDISS